ncbi:MAG TPA: response regulator transcription factor [Candidatus Desulfaltia sp.]|nr:response regulator transcription factor [Candidatus Desulfaltia sp.]
MNEFIAVVDDEPDIVELITLHLKKAGFKAEGFFEAKSFLDSLGKRLPDLVLLDLMLPDIDGLEVCKLLRRKEEWASIPVIMVTARGEEGDKVLGLELGADDYITKPFSAKELVARVKSVLRRQTGPAQSKKIEVGDLLTLDPEKYEVLVQGRKVDLTSTEFRILKLLASKKGWVFTRDQILDYLWGHEKIVLDRTIDVHIRNLREKLGPRAARMIKNIRGVGYKLEP